MPQPTASAVHVNRPLTNISIAYLQAQKEFIATKVFPTVPVAKQGDQYYVYPKDQWFRTDAQKRAPGTESAGSGYSISTDTYYCDPYALHKDIDDQTRANADAPINMDADATEFVTRQLLLRREKDFVAKYFGASIWTGAADFTPGTKWSATGSTPFADIRSKLKAVKDKTGFRPNKLVLAEDVWNILQDHSDLLDRIKYTQKGVVSLDLLASALDLEEVLVASAIENTAKEGATATMANLYSKHALVVYAAPRPSLMTPSGGYTFAWTGLLGAGQDGLRFKRFRMEQNASDRIEGEMAYDQKLVASDLGCFLKDVIA